VKDGNQYKLYVKGADSSILPCLKKNIDHPYQQNIEKNLESFAMLGYRTLVFAVRILTLQQFEIYSDKYNKAM
jgi:magnesium-transporting ATPase (P-type)